MKRLWQAEELVEHFTLLPEESTLLANKTGSTRLGFAVLLKFFQYEGRFPYYKSEIPEAVVAHMAKQVGVLPEQYPKYDWSGRTIKYHRAQIRIFLGFREVTLMDSQSLSGWLCQHMVSYEPREPHLKEAALQHLRQLRIEPPTPDHLERIIRSALHTHESRLCAEILSQLSPMTLAKLDALLRAAGPAAPESDDANLPEPERSVFSELKRDTGPVGVESILAEVAKLERINELDLPGDLFQDVSSKVLNTYRQRADAEPRRDMARHPAPIRYTLLAAFCWVRRKEIADNLVDLLIQVIHRIGTRAEKKVIKELFGDLRRVKGKPTLLYRISVASLKHPDDPVRDIVYSAAGGEQTLHDVIREFESTGDYQSHVQTRIHASYRNHYRRIMPKILSVLD
ncbi:MAG: DUF4158 domain-containing protein, partial [Bacteroidota bacterium]